VERSCGDLEGTRTMGWEPNWALEWDSTAAQCSARREAGWCGHWGVYNSTQVWYSDDLGKTYALSRTIFQKMDECTLAELSDGTVYLNMRNNHLTSCHCRGVARSSDGGTLFGALSFDAALPSPVCQATLSTPGDFLLFANPANNGSGFASARNQGTIKKSTDGGHTWTSKLAVTPEGLATQDGGSFDYSCLLPTPLKADPSQGGLLWSHDSAGGACAVNPAPLDCWLILFSRFPLDGPAWKPIEGRSASEQKHLPLRSAQESPPQSPGLCLTAEDCQLNGLCEDSKCRCDAAWQGDHCDTLVVEDGELAYGGPGSNVTSWGGGPPVWDAARGEWVLFVTEIANHCGLSEWQHMSTIVAATSGSPAGPYRRAALVLPPQAHNPYYAFDPSSRTHLIYHIGDGDSPASPSNPFKHCNNGTTPNLTATKLFGEYSSQPHILASKSLDGPFVRVNVTLPAGHTAVGWGNDNPAPFIFENGTVLMLTRKYNGTAHSHHIEPHDTIWLVRASSYEGPYELVFDTPVFEHENFNEEDPCIWRDQRGNFHALFHFSRGHAWSSDGIHWSWGGGRPAWTSTLRNSDGIVHTLRDAERPRIWVNATSGLPELLFVASGGATQPSKPGLGQLGFTVVQRIRAQKPEI